MKLKPRFVLIPVVFYLMLCAAFAQSFTLSTGIGNNRTTNYILTVNDFKNGYGSYASIQRNINRPFSQAPPAQTDISTQPNATRRICTGPATSYKTYAGFSAGITYNPLPGAKYPLHLAAGFGSYSIHKYQKIEYLIDLPGQPTAESTQWITTYYSKQFFVEALASIGLPLSQYLLTGFTAGINTAGAFEALLNLTVKIK